ncbi:MAG: hypothetical protein FJX42_05265 [Alphaproteobacteria bacterium]|nr:hypothetical protein [Alphaproteobacteria bacterium]
MAAVPAALLAAGPVAAADPASIDWSKVPAKTIKLFYPGQGSYQWLLSAEHKKGDKQVAAGKSCASCHEGDEADIGNKLVKGGPLEATPVPGKPGTIDLAVQAAYDDKNAYFRFRWKTQNNAPGDIYPLYRFDGQAWKEYGQPVLDKEVREGKQPGIYEDRLTLMIDDGKVPNFAGQGCWLTCHDGMRDMKNFAGKDQVAANPLLGAQKRSDVRKYLTMTRIGEQALWDKTKTAEEIAKLKADGVFVDLIQWRAHRSNPVGMADDGYVLEYRLFDAGKNMFGSNMNRETKQPSYMFDAKKTGVKSLTKDDLGKSGKPKFLIKDETAVPFDPNAGWKEGDMLPEVYLSRAEATGSAADNAYAKGQWADGHWTVVWVRPLNLANPDDKALKAGGAVSVGFAVHDGNITTRGHHVSFPVTLGFGVKADIQAAKLN